MKLFQKIGQNEKHIIYSFLFFSIKIRRKNKIIVVDGTKEKEVRRVKGLKVKFLGGNSVVYLYKPMGEFVGSEIICGSGCEIKIQPSGGKIRKLRIYAGANNTKCYIGRDFSLTKKCTIILTRERNLTVKIGDECMFASNIVIRTTDSHTIVDNEGNVINRGKDVVIKDHVWLCSNTTVLKGVTISEGVCVGEGSVVTKDCSVSNSIYAGVPAKIIKQGIKWDIRSIDDYEKENNIISD